MSLIRALRARNHVTPSLRARADGGRGVGGRPLDRKRPAKRGTAVQVSARRRARRRSVIEKVHAKHWAGSHIFSLKARRFTCANFVFMKGVAILIRHHTPTIHGLEPTALHSVGYSLTSPISHSSL